MTIREYPKNKKISISPTQLLKAAKKLGIPAIDVDYDLNAEQVALLDKSRVNYIGQVNNEAINSIKDMVTDRNVIIDAYKDMLKDKNISIEDRTAIEAQLEEIKNEKKDLQGTIRIYNGRAKNGEAVYARGEAIDPRIIDNGIAQLVVEDYDMKMGKISGANGKIAEENKKLTNLQNREYLTNFKKKKNEARQATIRSRITKLQTKEGKLQKKQQKIINRNLNRYLKKSERKFKKQYRLMSKEMAYVNEKTGLTNDLANTKANIEIETAEIERLKAGNLIDKIKSVGKRLDKKALELRVANLNHKMGVCNFKNQVRRTVRGVFHKNEKYVQPEVQQPVQPEVQQPVQPEVQQPVQPEVQQPVQPEAQQPVQPPNMYKIDMTDVMSADITNRKSAIETFNELLEKQQKEHYLLSKEELKQLIDNPNFTEEEKMFIKENLRAESPIIILDSSDEQYVEKMVGEKEILDKALKGGSLTEKEFNILVESSPIYSKYSEEINEANGIVEVKESRPDIVDEDLKKIATKYALNPDSLTIEEANKLIASGILSPEDLEYLNNKLHNPNSDYTQDYTTHPSMAM